MSFVCCGVKYNKNDPETYWCIETDLIKNYAFTKKHVNGDKVHKEVIETLICKKNGCLQVQVKRYGKLKNRFKILEIEKLSGDNAALFLIDTEKVRTRQLQVCPVRLVPYAKHIPATYAEVIKQNPTLTTARIAYIGNFGSGYKWRNVWDGEKWMPDIVNAPVKLSKI